MDQAQADARNGVLAGVLAFSIWGAFPLYFKIVGDVSPLEMLAQRIVWAVPFGAMIIFARHQWRDVRAALTNKRTMLLLALSATFITVNWFIYIYTVMNEQVFQASLGYYINPLMLMLVGFLFLGERLRPMQLVAVIFAAVGVGVLTVSGGQFPILSIALAASFTIYGAVRKNVVIGAMPGLFIETAILVPFAAAYLMMLLARGVSAMTPAEPGLAALLMFAGPLTVMPLLFFAVAARRLRLSTIGFLQFIGPTGQFAIGYYYGEPLTRPHLICFTMIWIAAALFIADVLLNGRRAITTIANRPE